MNRTAFSLPENSDYRTSGGLAISRTVEQFTGNARRLDDLIELLDRRRGVVLSCGPTGRGAGGRRSRATSSSPLPAPAW